jgi:HSP20 family molecular chaperone IbpA
MWAQACDLMVQVDREPPADVYEDEREIVVIIAMPGVAAERVQILSEPGVLVLRGTRPLPMMRVSSWSSSG